jgi:hypothetical protein
MTQKYQIGQLIYRQRGYSISLCLILKIQSNHHSKKCFDSNQVLNYDESFKFTLWDVSLRKIINLNHSSKTIEKILYNLNDLGSLKEKIFKDREYYELYYQRDSPNRPWGRL